MFNRLQINTVNLLATGGYIGLFYGAYLSHVKRTDSEIWAVLISIALFLTVFASLFNYWRLLKISEAATSTIAGAAQGYIELHGVATSSQNKPLKTPYQGIDCVVYRASAYADDVDEHGRKRSHLLEYLERKEAFRLSDETGFCMVDPEGAEILYLKKTTRHKNNHRYVEEYLPAGGEVYVIGRLDTRHQYNTTHAINQDVAMLLTKTKTKANKTQLLNQYDHNRDGQIDMQEWGQVRMDAIKHIESQHALKAAETNYVLTKPAHNELFLITALSPQQLRALLKCWHRIHLGVSIVLAMALLMFA